MVFGVDPVHQAVVEVLDRLERGDAAELESVHVDLKEEAGRRGPGGIVRPGARTNEAAAQKLAAEAACMANTDGGGALVVGVCDDGSLMGAELDGQWLRERIYALTDRRLTVDVSEALVRGVRLLVIRSPQAIEPVRVNGRVTWRVNDRCVEVDASTWHARRMTRDRYDWSEQSSHVPVDRVRPEALNLARRHLDRAGGARELDLARATDHDLLRRLNVVTTDGYLTNAGALAFVGRGEPALDYIRRAVAGGDSRRRVREAGMSLLEEIERVEENVDAFNETRHVQRGFVIARVPELPAAAVREAIVNGVVHRELASAGPTVVEHVGRSLVVNSPGGFVGGVTPENIITHPSQQRNRALAQLFADLHLAEREGIGVDRMVRDMIAVGYPPPSISEIPGPFVRAALVGDPLDEAWIGLLTRLMPSEARNELNVLLLLRRLVDTWWIDVAAASPILQMSDVETEAALHRLRGVTVDGRPVIEPVNGTPPGAPEAWRLAAPTWAVLQEEADAIGAPRRAPERAEVAMAWARHRGRVSTTELGSIVGTNATNVNRLLQSLEEDGLLAPGRSARTGRGFFYVLAAPEA
ncbi:ATP-binding protein [Cellulomonas sp. SLBN-39]|uniref:ATP-binding protein n=1 Tax=Cellulomonas sp. SLBN-39 TaxID=2768446 RepID=UPI00114EC1A2|nr:ATP-binding protein [Cellulomonas sp. SLBN-39]TQL02872.1 ATP-dependent DNA helicase RecG [Cellulomonas sp. SLBN-39]